MTGSYSHIRPRETGGRVRSLPLHPSLSKKHLKGTDDGQNRIDSSQHARSDRGTTLRRGRSQ